jgi:hypothetical protein
MDYGLENLLSSSDQQPLVKEISTEEALRAEVEMAKLDGQLDAEFAKEEMVVNYSTAIKLLVDKYEDKEMSNEALEVLTDSLEALSITGGFSKEHIVASVEGDEDKKSSTMAKMKTFIANLLKSFQVFYEKVMKYLTKWITKAKVLLTTNSKKVEELLNKIEPLIQEGCEVQLEHDKLITEGIKYILTRLKINKVTVDKLEDIKKINSKVYNEAVKLFNDYKETIEKKGGKVTIDEIVIRSERIAIFVKGEYPAKDNAPGVNFTDVIGVFPNEDILQYVAKTTFEFSDIDTYLEGRPLLLGLSKDGGIKQINEYFEEIKKEEKTLKDRLKEASERQSSTEKLIEIKQQSLKTIKAYRAKMSVVAKNNKLAVSGLNDLMGLCEKQNKEDNKEEK